MGKYWPLRQMLIIRYINSLSTAFQVDHTCQRGFFGVSFGGSTAPSALLPSGVPQGSILSPIHLVLYLVLVGSVPKRYGISSTSTLMVPKSICP